MIPAADITKTLRRPPVRSLACCPPRTTAKQNVVAERSVCVLVFTHTHTHARTHARTHTRAVAAIAKTKTPTMPAMRDEMAAKTNSGTSAYATASSERRPAGRSTRSWKYNSRKNMTVASPALIQRKQNVHVGREPGVRIWRGV